MNTLTAYTPNLQALGRGGGRVRVTTMQEEEDNNSVMAPEFYQLVPEETLANCC